jgi:Flp pilus assembly protein TadG
MRLKVKKMNSTTLQKQSGSGFIQLCSLVVLGLMLSAISVDFGINYAVQSNMQTAADSAALAGVGRLFGSEDNSAAERQADAIEAAVEIGNQNLNPELTSVEDSDIVLGYVDPETREYDRNTFTTPSSDSDMSFTGGYNAVRVSVHADESNGNQVPSIFSRLFGINQTRTSAHAVAMFDSEISEMTAGLRPIYGCMAQFQQTMADGDPTNDVVRVYNDYFVVNGTPVTTGCPPQGSGNWGFADLRDGAPGAPGNSTLADWWLNGFSGNPVVAGQYYSTQPGNSISSNNVRNALDTLIANQTVISIPLISTDYSGGGSNTQVMVEGFTGMVITDYVSNGSASSRYIEGYFTRAICTNNCRGGGDGTGGTGMVRLRLVH